MATTAESFRDTLRWTAGLLRTFVRRAVVFGAVAGLFALAVVLTTREKVSDCSGVTREQRALIDDLAEPSADRSFVASAPAECRDGLYLAPISGVATTMEAAGDQLVADGWSPTTNFVPYFDRLWRQCFRFAVGGWHRIEVIVEASRSGDDAVAFAVAPEGLDACERERRDESRIYPPRSGS